MTGPITAGGNCYEDDDDGQCRERRKGARAAFLHVQGSCHAVFV